MKQIISPKLFSRLIFILSIVVGVKLLWLTVSLLFLPTTGEKYEDKQKAKPLYYRVKLSSRANVIAPISAVSRNSKKQSMRNSSMRGIKLIALYRASDALVVTVTKGKRSTVLGKGEKIDGFELFSAGANYAVFTKGGKEFKLLLNNDKNIGKPSTRRSRPVMPLKKSTNKGIADEDGRKLINRDLLTSYTKNVDKIWKDIGIGENKQNGKLNGFKINFIKRGSDFEKLGLKRGDVLLAINAEPLDSYGAAMNFFKEIETIDNLTLTVQRNGQSEEIEYEIN
jgi:general secretion pathway protein C